MHKFTDINMPISPSRFPVLTGKTIPGRAPRLASWLRSIAERIEAWADRLDDRYESPFPVPTHENMPETVTWGNRYLTPAEIEQIAPDPRIPRMPE